ncbi:MAG: site-specific DNA-methyltransferase [Bacillota bacterium]
MQTEHKIIFKNAAQLNEIETGSVNLVVTSPPYPMIEMWDSLFADLNPEVAALLKRGDGCGSFELMHETLDPVWRELYRVMRAGAFACLNIGDATRTVNGRFQLFANHARVQNKMFALGFDVLPAILWRKQTNAPNKFMGSGMLPAGAYVTLEHEYILIFRKGTKRLFSTAEEKSIRRQSALFWEERNSWYTDVWDFKGIKQLTGNGETRSRSAAFPVVLPFRLINMFSVYGDLVLDPFLGTGTTALAAAAGGRNSIGYEIDPLFEGLIRAKFNQPADEFNRLNIRRLQDHRSFVQNYQPGKAPLKYMNDHYGFPVKTLQETALKLVLVNSVTEVAANIYRCGYHL